MVDGLGVLVSALPLVVPPLNYQAPLCTLQHFQIMLHWHGPFSCLRQYIIRLHAFRLKHTQLAK